MMKIERVSLGDLRANEDNPRTISGTQLEKLKMSLLVLPKMMELRPIVVDDGMVVLGGNQRLKALTAIAGMSDDEVSVLLQRSSDYSKKTKEEKAQLLESWGEWRRDPTAPIVKASELSDKQKEVMKLFAYRFLKINFEGVANYYAFNASEEEKRVIERLRMVLVDGGVEGFIEDDLLKVRGVVMDEEDPDGYE